MGARFLDAATGREVRVVARDEAKGLAQLWAPRYVSRRHVQAIAYRVMPDELLFDIEGARSGDSSRATVPSVASP